MNTTRKKPRRAILKPRMGIYWMSYLGIARYKGGLKDPPIIYIIGDVFVRFFARFARFFARFLFFSGWVCVNEKGFFPSFLVFFYCHLLCFFWFSSYSFMFFRRSFLPCCSCFFCLLFPSLLLFCFGVFFYIFLWF